MTALFMLLYKLIVNALTGHLNQDIEMSSTQPDRGISTAIRTTKKVLFITVVFKAISGKTEYNQQ